MGAEEREGTAHAVVAGDALEQVGKAGGLEGHALRDVRSEAVGLALRLARETVVDQRRADAAGDREPGHVAEDEADEQAGGRGRDELLHAVAMDDVAELVRHDAGELVGRLGLLEQRREVEGAAAGQREGVGHRGADDLDVGHEGRTGAFHRPRGEAGDGAVGEAFGVGIADLEARLPAERGLDLGDSGLAQLLLPLRG